MGGVADRFDNQCYNCDIYSKTWVEADKEVGVDEIELGGIIA